MIQRTFMLFCAITSVANVYSQTNIYFDLGIGKSQRNILFNGLSENSIAILRKNEIQNTSYNFELGVQRVLEEKVWLSTGIKYLRTSFQTKEVPFLPFWAPVGGIPDVEGYKVKVSEGSLILPLCLGYQILSNKRNRLIISTGLGVIYKLGQKTRFLIIYTSENSKSAWGVSNHIQKEYKISAEIPLKIQYQYITNRLGFGFNIQYDYILGKTNTQVTEDGYGYIGIKEQTTGRMSSINIGISFTYNNLFKSL